MVGNRHGQEVAFRHREPTSWPVLVQKVAVPLLLPALNMNAVWLSWSA